MMKYYFFNIFSERLFTPPDNMKTILMPNYIPLRKPLWTARDTTYNFQKRGVRSLPADQTPFRSARKAGLQNEIGKQHCYYPCRITTPNISNSVSAQHQTRRAGCPGKYDTGRSHDPYRNAYVTTKSRHSHAAAPPFERSEEHEGGKTTHARGVRADF